MLLAGRYPDLHPVKRVDGIIRAPFGFADDFDLVYFIGKGGEYRFHFSAGHVLADTDVDARAKGQMAGGAAGYVELVGVFPAIRVAIGRSQCAEDLAAFFDIDVRNAGVEAGRAAK